VLNLIQMLAGRPWAIRGEIAAHVHKLIHREGFAALRELAGVKGMTHATDEHMAAAGLRGSRQTGAVAVVNLIGMMTQRGDVVNSQQTLSTDAFAARVAELATDSRIDAIVIDVDSPGGEVSGVPEAFATLKAAAKLKPIVAVANSQMASAALYVSSAATEIWVQPSGEAGSLGVFTLHVDESKALEAEGVGVEFIVADDSPFKTEGASTGPLSEDARAQAKKTVNRYMSMFVRDVAKGRGVSVQHVRENFGKGRMLGPQEAVSAKMADAVGTLDQAIRRASQLAAERRRDGNVRATSAEDLLPEPVAALIEPDPEPAPNQKLDLSAQEPAAVAGLTPDQIAALARLSTL